MDIIFPVSALSPSIAFCDFSAERMAMYTLAPFERSTYEGPSSASRHNGMNEEYYPCCLFPYATVAAGHNKEMKKRSYRETNVVTYSKLEPTSH